MKKYFNIFKIFTNKTNAKFGLGVCSVVLSSSVCFAAVQATSKDGKIFYISEHSFKDNQVYDPQAEIFKKINGKNFYASKSKYPISNLTMIYNNPKSGNKNLSKLEILTPDTSKEEIITAFSALGTVSSDTQAVPSSFIPFIVTAYAQNTNATNNKLILENGELSSVYFCKPSIGDCGVPNNSQKGDRFKYLITAAFTDRGGGFNNQTILKENSYINMGVENIYTLPLNGAPYISGSVAFDGEAKDNKLILESNTKIDLHDSQYFSDEEGKDIYDERITRLMGAFGINSNLQNNKVLIDSANIVLHGPDGEYKLVQPLKFWVL